MLNERLFVYGTLRSDVRDSRFHLLAGDARRVGRARVRGRLLCLGGYPGLVSSAEAASWVHGELYTLADPVSILSRLDRYEGAAPEDPEPRAFERIEMEVTLDGGAIETAWVYVYRGPTAGRPEIASGDFKTPR